MFSEARFETTGTVRKIEKGGNGRQWLRLTIPVDRSYRDQNEERVERTTWCEAVCFNPKLIDIIEKLNVEGRLVRIRGDIEIGQREFEGKKIRETSLYIDQLKVLDAKPQQDDE